MGTPPGAASARWTGSEFIGVALILAATLAIAAPSLDRPFFADDYLFLDQARGRSIGGLLSAPDPIGNFYRPVGRQLFFGLTRLAFGESPLAFHVVGLVLFLAVPLLLYAIARRLAGPRAAIVAAAIVSIHYAADVPLIWASGVQETIAVAGALGAILLHLRGARWPAAGVLALAVLSKETALVTPLVAAVLDRRAGETWSATLRRAWPLGLALLVWALVRLFAPGARHVGSPAAGLATVAGVFQGLVAAIAHLPQVVAGLEWRRGSPLSLDGRLTGVLAVALAGAAVVIAARGAPALRNPKPAAARDPSRRPAGAARPPARRAAVDAGSRHAIGAGLLWALLASLPIAVVAPIWSAYYYLLAVCGAALAIGAWASLAPAAAGAVVVALLGLGSAHARGLDEFATANTPWSGQSHINRFYVERATRQVEGYLRSLKRLRPELPPRTTLLFSGLRANVAFQTADGPLFRWAYGDSTLRSYFVNQFTAEKARRGPYFLFVASGDTLKEVPPEADPQGLVAIALLMGGRVETAAEVLRQVPEGQALPPSHAYLLAWIEWELGRHMEAMALLERHGQTLAERAPPFRDELMAMVNAGDTTMATAMARRLAAMYALDGSVHGFLADLYLVRDPDDANGLVEAWAARVLSPDVPQSWMRWGMVQIRHGRHADAATSLERYLAMLARDGRTDARAQQMLTEVRQLLPGGLLSQKDLRN